MNNIIIADKDVQFVKSLAKRIREEFSGFSPIEIMGDGDMALKAVKSNKAEVALINAELYGVSGIDVLKQAQLDKSETMIMLMSDSRNFDYAKAAADFKAERFFLKPFSMQQLFDALATARKSVEERIISAHDAAERYLMEWEWKRQNISLVYNGLFPFDGAAKKEKAFWAGRRLYECYCFVVDFEITNYENQVASKFGGSEETFYDAVIGLGEEDNPRFAAYQVSSTDNHIIYVVLSAQKNRLMVEQFAENLLNSLKSLYQITAAYTMNEYSSLGEVVRFNEAKRISARYLAALSDNDAEAAAEITELVAKTGDDKQIVTVIKTLVTMLKERYDVYYADVIKRAGFWAGGVDHIMLLRELLNRAATDISTSRHLIVGIKDYISRNFGGGISVESIANAFSMNASYLGRVFKEETGEKLVDYLFNIRMQKAKEMLASGKYTVKETAYSVGYNQIKYFGAIFKQHTGQTPSQYMKSQQLHQDE